MTKTLIKLNKGEAVAKEIGSRIAEITLSNETDQTQLNALRERIDRGKFEEMSLLTMVQYESCLAGDKRINPYLAVNGAPAAEWRKQPSNVMQVLGYVNQDGTVTETGQAFYADPNADDKGSPEWKARQARRNNLATKIKAAAKQAVGYIESGAKVEYDKQARTIRVVDTGELPKQITGTEKTPLVMDGSKREGATEKASGAAVARYAESLFDDEPKAGKVSENKVETDAQAAAKSEESFIALVNTMANTIRRREKKFSVTEAKALRNLAVLLNSELSDTAKAA